MEEIWRSWLSWGVRVLLNLGLPKAEPGMYVGVRGLSMEEESQPPESGDEEAGGCEVCGAGWGGEGVDEGVCEAAALSQASRACGSTGQAGCSSTDIVSHPKLACGSCGTGYQCWTTNIQAGYAKSTIDRADLSWRSSFRRIRFAQPPSSRANRGNHVHSTSTSPSTRSSTHVATLINHVLRRRQPRRTRRRPRPPQRASPLLRLPSLPRRPRLR